MKKHLKIIVLSTFLLVGYVNEIYAGGDTLRLTESEARSLVIQTMPDSVKNDSFSSSQNYLAYENGSEKIKEEDSFSLAKHGTQLVLGKKITTLVSPGKNLPNTVEVKFENSKRIPLWPFIVFTFLLPFVGTLFFCLDLKIYKEVNGHDRPVANTLLFCLVAFVLGLALASVVIGREIAALPFLFSWTVSACFYYAGMFVLATLKIENTKAKKVIYLSVVFLVSLITFLLFHNLMSIVFLSGTALGLLLCEKLFKKQLAPASIYRPS